MRTCWYTRLAAGVCLAMLAGCSSTSTVMQVERDESREVAPIKKTLVVASLPRRATSDALEDEWVTQLRKRGVDAHALHVLLPGASAADEQSVVEAVKGNAIDTVLVSKLVRTRTDESTMSRTTQAGGAPGGMYADYQSDISVGSQGTYTVEREVAVVQTNLRDTKTQKIFWSARSDNLLEASTDLPIQSFVEVMIKEMAKTSVF
jgi:hypothetical protein